MTVAWAGSRVSWAERASCARRRAWTAAGGSSTKRVSKVNSLIASYQLWAARSSLKLKKRNSAKGGEVPTLPRPSRAYRTFVAPPLPLCFANELKKKKKEMNNRIQKRKGIPGYFAVGPHNNASLSFPEPGSSTMSNMSTHAAAAGALSTYERLVLMIIIAFLTACLLFIVGLATAMQSPPLIRVT